MLSDPSFHYAVCGRSHVAVHGPLGPSDAEWQAYLDDITQHLTSIKGVIVHTTGGGPSAAQRRAATEHWKRVGETPRMAILTTSKVVRAMVETLGFFLGSNVRAFPFDAFDEAGRHLGLSPQGVSSAQAKAAELRARL
jgi:hypothetical protein